MIPRPVTASAPHIKGAHGAAAAGNAPADPQSGAAFAQLVANSGLSTMNFVALHQNGDFSHLTSDDHAQSKSKGNNNRDAGTPAQPQAAPQAPPQPLPPAPPPAAQGVTDATNSAAQTAAVTAALATQAAQQAAQNAPASAPQTNTTATSSANPQLLPTSNDPTQPANQNSGPSPAPAPPGAAALNARIVAAAPTLLSQPSTVFAGLWHHADAAGAKAVPQSGADAGATSPSGDTGNTDSASAQNDAPPRTAAPALQTTPSPHEAIDSVINASASDAVNAGPPAQNPPPQDNPAPPPAAMPMTTTVALAPVNPNPVVPAAMTIMPPMDQVAFSLKQAVQNGTDRIEIQLKPASLGAIDVKLDLSHDGKVTAVISADRSDTLNMLRQDADQLQQALRDAGLQADSNSLSFNLRSDQQPAPQYAAPVPAGAAPPSDDSLATTSAVASQRLRRHDGTLDIQV